MFLLVFSGSLLTLFVAWDLLGFCSLFLVFYYRSRSSLAGGLLTGITNRLGDALLLLAFGLSGLLALTTQVYFLVILFLVAFTKSAQVPFSAWLPAAMLAPTPVSALVHSSTLVTAGVYLLYRYAYLSSSFLMWVGIFTTLYAGWSCILESDIKKIIALSTLSQLGIIVSSLGLGLRALAFTHLNFHASFKALLFLTVGTLIHVSYGSQEARTSLSLVSLSPFILVFMIIGLLSMCGIVFLAGSVSKEALLECCYNSSVSYFFLFFFYFGIGLTLSYRFRLGYLFRSPLLSGSSSVSALPLAWPTLLPMSWLACNRVVQGTVWSALSIHPLASLSHLDNVIVFVVLFAFWSLAASNINRVCPVCSPGLYQTSCTQFLGLYSVAVSDLFKTDKVLSTGGGLAAFPSLFSGLRPGRHLFVRGLLFLSFCFLLL